MQRNNCGTIRRFQLDTIQRTSGSLKSASKLVPVDPVFQHFSRGITTVTNRAFLHIVVSRQRGYPVQYGTVQYDFVYYVVNGIHFLGDDFLLYFVLWYGQHINVLPVDELRKWLTQNFSSFFSY